MANRSVGHPIFHALSSFVTPLGGDAMGTQYRVQNTSRPIDLAGVLIG